MLVEKRSRRTGKTGRKEVDDGVVGGERNSRFQVLENLEDDEPPRARAEGGAMSIERAHPGPLKPGLRREVGPMSLDQNSQYTAGLKFGKSIGDPSWTSTTLGERINKTGSQHRSSTAENQNSLNEALQSPGCQRILKIGEGPVETIQNEAGNANSSILPSPRTDAGLHEPQDSNTEPSSLEGTTRASNRGTFGEHPAPPTLQAVQEIMQVPTAGILDSSKHSVVLFKEDHQPTTKGFSQKNRGKSGTHQAVLRVTRGITKTGNTRKGKNLKKEKGNPFKVSPTKNLLSESISSMVELLQTQVQQGLVNEVPVGIGRKA
ncbi:hypothetical protein J1N35_002726 [Gossypium stocksii]|uniref:Uncharacterized protein n=1 Tax=Gossypium stocksii TaxID=47602 RepID=A0A9D3WMM4_9ROSI|nr:hypothetical protein J1N35_002726 [Gossypium stocksii]